MITKLIGKELTWIDLVNPKRKDFATLQKEITLHPLVLTSLHNPVHHPRLERFDSHFFLIVHIPIMEERKREVLLVELDIVVGKNYIVTTHTQRLPALEDLQYIIQQGQKGERGLLDDGVGHFLYTLLSSSFEALFPTLDALEDGINHIEEEIFREKEQEIVSEISILHRNVIDFRRALGPARPVLEALLEEGEGFLEPKSRPYIRRISEQVKRMISLLDAHKETIAALEETNQALLTTKTNEIIKVLTVITAVTIPFAVVGGIWGMNVLLPLGGENPAGFLMLLALMIAASIGMLVWFRTKKWI